MLDVGGHRVEGPGVWGGITKGLFFEVNLKSRWSLFHEPFSLCSSFKKAHVRVCILLFLLEQIELLRILELILEHQV